MYVRLTNKRYFLYEWWRDLDTVFYFHGQRVMIGKNRIIWFSERNVGLGSRSKNTEKEPIIRFHVL